jgi:hypothetical protein
MASLLVTHCWEQGSTSEEQMDEREARERWYLRQARFGEGEIARLRHLRCQYSAEGDRLESLAYYRRLQFVRWLVRTGRLTEGAVTKSGRV